MVTMRPALDLDGRTGTDQLLGYGGGSAEMVTVTVVVRRYQPRPAGLFRRWHAVTALAVAVAGVMLIGVGACASSTAAASGSSSAVPSAGAGSPRLVDVNGAAFSSGVSDLLPGDYFHRYIDVVNDGTRASVFTGQVTATGELAGQFTVDAVTCTVPWTTVGGASTCAGTTSNSLGSGTPTEAVPIGITHGTIGAGAGAAQHVRYTFTFSGTASSPAEGETGAVTISVGDTVIGGAGRTAA